MRATEEPGMSSSSADKSSAPHAEDQSPALDARQHVTLASALARHMPGKARLLRESEGAELAGDVVHTDQDGGLAALEAELARLREDGTPNQRTGIEAFEAFVDPEGGLLGSVFGAEREQLLRGYLVWSRKGEQAFNVSRAARRVAALGAWIAENGAKVGLSTLRRDDAKEVARQGGLFCSPTLSATGQRVLFVHAARLLGVRDTMQCTPERLALTFFFVLVSLSMRPEVASEGLIIVEDLSGIGMGTMFSSWAWRLKSYTDPLSLGASAVKMKRIVVFQEPVWMDLVTAVAKRFLARKITERISLMGKRSKAAVLTDIMGSLDGVPNGFWEGAGGHELRDVLFAGTRGGDGDDDDDDDEEFVSQSE